MDAFSGTADMHAAVRLLSDLPEPACLVSADGRLAWRNTAFDDRVAVDPSMADALSEFVAGLHGPEAPVTAHMPDETGLECSHAPVGHAPVGHRTGHARVGHAGIGPARPGAPRPDRAASRSAITAPGHGATAAPTAPAPDLDILHWPLRDAAGTARGCAVILRDPTADPALHALRATLLDIANDLHADPATRIEAILAAADRHCGLDGAALIETAKGPAPIHHGARPDEAATGQRRSVPVRLESEQVGLLCLVDPATAGPRDAQDREPDRALDRGLALCAESLAREIAQQRREAALREEAWRDWLTGAATRRAFESALRDALRAPYGSGPGNSLLIFDLDRFKSVNDTFGHALGDRVLRAVARLVREMLPETLPLYRIGGEEFALILPQTGTRAACALAETLRERIAGLTLPHGLRITASFGVARTAARHDEAARLYARADRALYAAKRAGRNRIKRAATPGASMPPVPTRIGSGDLMHIKARPLHH